MPLSLMYITNRPEVALIAERAGVDSIFLDMEYLWKNLRQGGLDTVQNYHSIEDVRRIREVLKSSSLLVRINPIHDKFEDIVSSEDEINRVIDAGADTVMLPMYKSYYEVERFLTTIDGRAKTILLAETVEAISIMSDVMAIKEVDSVHIGLNDLHLAMKKGFMFELLADGTVDKIIETIKPSGKKYGFGGIARIGYGQLPAEYVLGEHYRLGSSMTILSRSFCNAATIENLDYLDALFSTEVRRIRQEEKIIAKYDQTMFRKNHETVCRIVDSIVKSLNT